MDIEWEKDNNGDWTLKMFGNKVRYLTNQQKEDLEKIFRELKDEVKE